jgi:hypothetical protein
LYISAYARTGSKLIIATPTRIKLFMRHIPFNIIRFGLPPVLQTFNSFQIVTV